MQKLIFKQKGVALILFALVLVLAVTAFLVSSLDASDLKIERDKNNALILAKAKTALIGYAIGVIGSGQRPGDLIMPDSFGISEYPANYDGTADSGCLDATAPNGLPLINSDKNMRCIGRLPWKELGLSLHAPSQNDPTGVMPWYAVSANLVDTTCLKVLNSDALNLVNNPSGSLDCSGASLPYPWLTVRDSDGNILSNRVAAVIFLPNAPRGAQSRASSPLGDASQYLDTLPAHNNADMDNDFIIASEGVPAASASNFNDQLVYITIEELMAAVEKRVAGEARKQLTAYKTTNVELPFAASIGYQGQSCVQGLDAGFLPLPICRCTGSMCDCAFPATIMFESDRNYNFSNGSCVYSGRECTCTGAGSCLRTSGSTRSFVCTAAGTCVSNVSGRFEYRPAAPIDADSMSVNGSCSLSSSAGSGQKAICNGAGNVVINGSTNQCTLPILNANSFPLWFWENGWKHFIYYAKGSLSVGINSASSVLVTSGSMLAVQSRPSGSMTDYLDKPDPVPYGDTVFDAIGTPRTSTYNDQMFIVAP